MGRQGWQDLVGCIATQHIAPTDNVAVASTLRLAGRHAPLAPDQPLLDGKALLEGQALYLGVGQELNGVARVDALQHAVRCRELLGQGFGMLYGIDLQAAMMVGRRPGKE